jgi:hypothetical protein
MKYFLALLASSLLMIASLDAQITNGGFETGSFPPWTTTGNDQVTGTYSGQAPEEGNFQAAITTTSGGTVTQASLETFLGLNAGSLNSLNPPNQSVDGGSAIKQTFTVQNGQVISFWWDFLPGSLNAGNDYGFFTLHRSSVPSSSFTVLAAGGSTTGYRHFVTQQLAAGTYQLGFSAYETTIGPGNLQSRPDLLIDNVQLLSCAPVPSGLVSWWPANGNPADMHGGNAGTLENGAGFAAGEVGQAFSLNGTNQDVLIGDPANLKLSPSFTIDAWINPNSVVDFRAVLTKWGQSDSLDNYAVWIEDAGNGTNQVNAQWVVSGPMCPCYDGISGGSVPANTWTHVAVTYDGVTGDTALYINGSSVNSFTATPHPLQTTDAPVYIGREAGDGTGRYFPGRIDEVEVFNRALTQSEIQAIVNAGPAGKCLPIMYAATGSNGVAGNLYTVDPSTAASILVAPITNAAGGGGIGVTGLDFNPLDHVLYGVTSESTNNGNTVIRSLVTINPNTAVAAVIGDLGVANSDISFRTDGTLFGFEGNSPASTTHSMTNINLTTGASTPVGNAGLSTTAGGGLAFDEDGTLYLSATGTGGTLDTLNPTTGLYRW